MITFEKIRWKNFLSTGNQFTELDLIRSTTTLIVGQNGAGKSTILDALTFVLFGKPYRKINKPQLLNSINNANCVVEIEFTIGKKKYKVVRGIKPNLFEIYCDNKLVNQDSKSKDYQEHLEKNILKLNFKSFTQVVILGSASFIPFMQLSSGDRRTIIEELLDIGIFSSMNVLVKNKITFIKDEQKNIDYDIKLFSEKIEMQKQYLEESKKSSQAEVDKRKKEIEVNNSFIEKTINEISLIQKHVDVMSKKVEDRTLIDSKSKQLLQFETKFESNKKKIQKEIIFYETNDNCPTCLQSLEVSHKTNEIEKKKQKLKDIDEATKKLESEITKINEKITKINDLQKKITDHQYQLVTLNTQVTSTNKYNQKLLDEIKELQNRSSNMVEVDTKLISLKNEHDTKVEKAKELAEEKQYYEFAANLLKDTGIKTKIIKQYLPIMNKLINKYLTSMDFFVNFNLNENFEESIKSRHRDEFSYASFSEGEKMRIDLALLLTWRQVAKIKNSTNTNLLILDEVFDSSLDTIGTEEFLKLLNDMDKKTNVFVISHKGDQLFDKFRSVIKFEKRKNFSQVAK